jgi:hypothetical protein
MPCSSFTKSDGEPILLEAMRIPDEAIHRLLALRNDAESQTVHRAADDALAEILSLEAGLEED